MKNLDKLKEWGEVCECKEDAIWGYVLSEDNVPLNAEYNIAYIYGYYKTHEINNKIDKYVERLIRFLEKQ